MASDGPIYLFMGSPVGFLWNGPAAVSLFFVLSGFVLSLPYMPVKKASLRFGEFIIRRLFRLYPAYWFAIATALFLLHFTPLGARPPGMTDWFAQFWQTPPTIQQILRHLILVGPGIDPNAIDPVIWSLMVEMRVSLIFPLIILLFSSTRKTWHDVVILAAALSVGIVGHRFALVDVESLPQFFLGAAAAKYRDGIMMSLGASPLVVKITTLAIGILLYGNASILPGMFEAAGSSLYVTALGAAVIIMTSLSSRTISGVLEQPAITFYGDISYSFYLIHFPILLFLTPRLAVIPYAHGVIVIVAFVLSSLVAAALFKFVEMPFQALGFLISNRLRSIFYPVSG